MLCLHSQTSPGNRKNEVKFKFRSDYSLQINILDSFGMGKRVIAIVIASWLNEWLSIATSTLTMGPGTIFSNFCQSPFEKSWSRGKIGPSTETTSSGDMDDCLTVLNRREDRRVIATRTIENLRSDNSGRKYSDDGFQKSNSRVSISVLSLHFIYFVSVLSEMRNSPWYEIVCVLFNILVQKLIVYPH